MSAQKQGGFLQKKKKKKAADVEKKYCVGSRFLAWTDMNLLHPG